MSDYDDDEAKELTSDYCSTDDEGDYAQETIAAIASDSAGDKVDLDENNIGDAAAAAIGEGLSNNTTLQQLGLEYNDICDVGAAAIGEGLSKNASLQTLFLSVNNISDIGTAAIGEGLSKNTTLQQLRLSENKIGDVGAAAIGEAIRKSSILQQLRLNQNKISDVGAAAIGEGLGKNATLQYLDLDDNNICDVGASAIGEGLSNNATLQTLSIRKNNISGVGACAIGEALSKNTALQTLFLSKNNIGDVGAAAIGEGISTNVALKHLSLNLNNIGDVGAAVIGEGISQNTALKELSLTRNNIGDGFAAAIGAGISKNAALQRLYLNKNNISDVGAAAIGYGLIKNIALQRLELHGNKITQSGYLALAKGFRWNENMTVLEANPEETEYMKTEKIKEIGRGEFGSVCLASTEDGEQVVEKISHSTSNREEIYERLMLQGLPEHKNIVRLAAISLDDTLLLEAHNGGSVKAYAKMQEHGTPLPRFLSYSHGMCLAIEHLHRHGIIHRDIALRNYVLTEDLETPVLVDFGLSWPIQEEKYVMIRPKEMMPFRQCAPEVISALQYSKGADIWQFGLAVWQLLHRGRQPFFQFKNGHQLVEYLHKKMVEQKGHIPLSFKKNGASPALISAVEQLVVFCCPYDPAARPTATRVVKKIESLGESVGGEAVDGEAEEEKVVSKYEPSEIDVDGGLMAYNYTDYQSSETGGGSAYVDLENDLEEHENGYQEFSDVDVEEEGEEQEPGYQEL